MERRVRAERGRAVVELEAGGFRLLDPDGGSRAVAAGRGYGLIDAACSRRFVRLLRLDGAALITPPEHGAIAPRAAHLPLAPDDAAVVDAAAFDVLLEWLARGARIDGRTIEELARLSRMASATLAVALGEAAGQAARELGWGGGGPMRGSGLVPRRLLRPLEVAALDSERAGDALTAALAQWPANDER